MSVSELDQVLLSLTAKGVRLMPVHALIDGKCSCDRPECPDPAKHPLTPNGVHDATCNVRVLTGWHGEAGGVENWAVATGPESNLWVFDIDPRHGGGETLAALLAEHGPLPDTWTVAAGGGGRHHYFRWPPTLIVPSKGNIAPGIDVRGAGGYAICPPSVHASGGPYRWLVGPDGPLADAPDWLIEKVAGPVRQPVKAVASVAKPSAANQTVAPGTGLIVTAGPGRSDQLPGGRGGPPQRPVVRTGRPPSGPGRGRGSRPRAGPGVGRTVRPGVRRAQAAGHGAKAGGQGWPFGSTAPPPG